MSDPQTARVSVRILEKDYPFACALEERAALLDAAEFLNSEMKKIRDSGKVIGLDRIAVMAALNIANEFLKLKNKAQTEDPELLNRVRMMRERVESSLARGQQLEI